MDELFKDFLGDLPKLAQPDPDQAPFTVQKIGYLMPISEAALRESKEFWDGIAENERRRAALTPEQRAAEDAEWEERRAREKAERTCPHCGCDPDEHGDY